MGPVRAASVAFAVGCAVMGVELTAVRLLAPHFGDSAYVWTNVIGVILVALALGAWLGGRAAAGPHLARGLVRVLVAGGIVTAFVPLVAKPLGAWLLPADLPLDAALPALVRGSLAASLLLFAPPVLCAGMATPMLVTAVAAGGRGVGAASGLVAAWSTLGSLAGTFAATHLLVPGIGSRATLVVCAALLIAAGVAARPGRAAVALLVPIAALAIPLGPRRDALPGERLVAEVESRYQYLTVVRDGGDGGPETTRLRINEGLDSFHSIAVAGTPWTGGAYYDWFAALPFLRGDGGAPKGLRVLSLGAAAGTFERLLAHVCEGATFDSVELDPEVVRLATREFGGFPASARVHAGIDARVFVGNARASWDLVLLDAYERQIYIPAHLASREFFTAVRERLLPGGIVAVNAGGRRFDDPVVAVVAGTMAAAFGEARAFRVPRSRNFIVAARRDAALDPASLAPIRTGEPELDRVLARVAQPSGWRTFAPGDVVLTDDRPFLDRVQDVSLQRDLGAPELTAMAGSVAPAEAEQAAFAALRADDDEALDRALRGASAATAALRLYAGDGRWRGHDPHGAREEYRAALALAPALDVKPLLEERLASVGAELEQLERARGVARRDAWLALGAALVLGAAVALVARRVPCVAA